MMIKTYGQIPRLILEIIVVIMAILLVTSAVKIFLQDKNQEKALVPYNCQHECYVCGKSLQGQELE